jgi:hypothetical protein
MPDLTGLTSLTVWTANCQYHFAKKVKRLLTPYRDVVDQHHHSTIHRQDIYSRANNASLFDDPSRNRRSFWFPDLNSDES